MAKRASELAPKEPVVVQLKQQSLVLRRLRNNSDVKAASEEGVWVSLHEVEKSAVYGLKEDQNIAFPDKKKWDQLTMSRAKLKALGRAKRSEKEMEIEQPAQDARFGPLQGHAAGPSARKSGQARPD